MKIFLSLLLFSAFSIASDAHLIRQCRVYDKPAKNAKLVCTLKAGSEAKVIGSSDSKVVEISSSECSGFLYSSCLSLNEKTASNDSKVIAQPPPFLKMGVGLDLEGLLAKVGSSTTYSSGVGIGLSVLGEIKVSRGIYAQILPGYRHQKLSRSLDGSGSLRDPNPGSYSQTVGNFSLGLGGAVNIFELLERNFRYPWIVKLGGEFLLPISAKQTDPSGSEDTFTATKMVNLVVGSGILFPFTEKMGIRVGGDILYHVTAKDSTSLIGLRLGAVGIFNL